MTPAIWIAPDHETLTERQQRVLQLLVAREVDEFKTLRQLTEILGDSSPTAVGNTIEALRKKGLVREAPAPLHWSVCWVSRPAAYVRQGRRDGWILRTPPAGTSHT